ncbi:hypothetical protein D3C77_289510 [compost metagenome]
MCWNKYSHRRIMLHRLRKYNLCIILSSHKTNSPDHNDNRFSNGNPNTNNCKQQKEIIHCFALDHTSDILEHEILMLQS